VSASATSSRAVEYVPRIPFNMDNETNNENISNTAEIQKKKETAKGAVAIGGCGVRPLNPRNS
jgi:hypothetical protein